MKRKNVIGLYLAAGKSRRMGCDKLSLSLQGTTVGSMALRKALASNLSHVAVVTKNGDPLEWMDPFFFSESTKKKWTHVRCLEAERGQAHALRCGLTMAQDFRAEAIVILLADQPFITTEMINELIEVYKKQSLSYVAAGYGGIPLPPVLFSHEMFPQLASLKGDKGARRLLRENNGREGMVIDYKNSTFFRDIDTREDYRAIKADIENKHM